MVDPDEALRRVSVHLGRVLDEAGMSVAELSRRTGISVVNLSILKANRAKAIRFSALTAICDGLHCQPADLLHVQPAAHPDPQQPEPPTERHLRNPIHCRAPWAAACSRPQRHPDRTSSPNHAEPAPGVAGSRAVQPRRDLAFSVAWTAAVDATAAARAAIQLWVTPYVAPSAITPSRAGALPC